MIAGRPRVTFLKSSHIPLLVLALALALAVAQLSLRSPALAAELARAMQGEQWYAVRLDEQHIGTFRQAIKHQHDHWLFSSELAFEVNPGMPVAIRERLRFADRQPFVLLAAEQQILRPGSRQRVTIDAHGRTLRATIESDRGQETIPLTWTYNLNEHLAVERWLHESPRLNSKTTSRSIDYQRLQLMAKQWRLVARNVNDTHLVNDAPDAPTSVVLDRAYRPLTMTTAEHFVMQRAPRSVAIARSPGFGSHQRWLALDRPIGAPETVARLRARVSDGRELIKDWELVNATPQGLMLERTATQTLSSGPPERRRGKAIALPTQADAIERFTRTLRDDPTGTPEQLLKALMTHVHASVTYSEQPLAQDVLATLERRTGDCTEFAELFATAAEHLGIPTRVVWGLAYSDAAGPGFALHAWNESWLGNRWHPIDPTWHQWHVDATHLPLPEDPVTSMRLLAALPHVALELISVERTPAD